MVYRSVLTTFVFCLGLVWLTACGATDPAAPIPTTQADVPSPATQETPMPAAEKPTPTPEAAPVRGPLPAKPAIGENMGQGMAYVDAVTVLPGTPKGTAKLRVLGNLADGCTELAGHDSTVTEDQLAVTLYTSRDPNLMCTQALVPFDTVLTVDLPDVPQALAALSAGTLAVSVNGVLAGSVSPVSAFSVDGDGCPVETAGLKRYRSGLGPFCFLYPAEYELFEAAATIISVAAPARLDGSAERVMFTLTFGQAGVSDMAQVEASVRSASTSTNTTYTQGSVAGFPALIVQNPPDIVGSRQAYFLANGIIYTLNVQPIDPIALPNSTAAAEALWRTVTDSFALATATE